MLDACVSISVNNRRRKNRTAKFLWYNIYSMTTKKKKNGNETKRPIAQKFAIDKKTRYLYIYTHIIYSRGLFIFIFLMLLFFFLLKRAVVRKHACVWRSGHVCVCVYKFAMNINFKMAKWIPNGKCSSIENSTVDFCPINQCLLVFCEFIHLLLFFFIAIQSIINVSFIKSINFCKC